MLSIKAGNQKTMRVKQRNWRKSENESENESEGAYLLKDNVLVLKVSFSLPFSQIPKDYRVHAQDSDCLVSNLKPYELSNMEQIAWQLWT